MRWNSQELYSEHNIKSEFNIIIVSIIMLLSLAFPSCSSRHLANFGFFIITKRATWTSKRKSERKGTRDEVSLFKFINGSEPEVLQNQDINSIMTWILRKDKFLLEKFISLKQHSNQVSYDTFLFYGRIEPVDPTFSVSIGTLTIKLIGINLLFTSWSKQNMTFMIDHVREQPL